MRTRILFFQRIRITRYMSPNDIEAKFSDMSKRVQDILDRVVELVRFLDTEEGQEAVLELRKQVDTALAQLDSMTREEFMDIARASLCLLKHSMSGVALELGYDITSPQFATDSLFEKQLEKFDEATEGLSDEEFVQKIKSNVRGLESALDASMAWMEKIDVALIVTIVNTLQASIYKNLVVVAGASYDDLRHLIQLGLGQISRLIQSGLF